MTAYSASTFFRRLVFASQWFSPIVPDKEGEQEDMIAARNAAKALEL
jgi:hypothetical protein